jgi:hypothetical protein
MVHLEFTYTPAEIQEQVRTKAPKSIRNSMFLRSKQTWFFVVLIVIMYVAIQFWTASSSPAPAPTTQATPVSLSDLLVPLLPWVGLFLFIWLVAFRFLRGNIGKIMWTRHSLLQQPQKMEIDDDGLRINTPRAESLYRWNAFNGWSESKNLIILYIPSISRISIPKRAVADPLTLNEIRQTLDRHIHAQTRAFPVLPANPI